LPNLAGCAPEPAPNARPVEIDAFRTSGRTSDENTCQQCPRDLGVVPGIARNGMELRATVRNNVPGMQYDIKRTRKERIFHLDKDGWHSYTGPGRDDDTDNSDETLTPVNGHIYSIDQPGLIDPQDPGAPADATGWVQKLTMKEWVMMRTGPTAEWKPASNDFYWYSVVWLTKVGDTWQTDAARSEIKEGSINVDTKEP